MQTTQNAAALQDRLQRLETQLRCDLAPEHPGMVRAYVHAGLHLVRRGFKPAAEVRQRVFATLLASARDEGLPWFWRSVWMEHVSLRMARLRRLGTTLCDWEAAVPDLRDSLPVTPAACGE